MTNASRPRIGAYLLFALLYYLTAYLGGDYTTSPEGMAIIWAPNAVLLAMLLRYDGAGYPVFALLGLIAEMLGDMPSYAWHQSIYFGLVDLAEATLAWRLMRAMGMSPVFETVEDLGKFVLAGPLVATLVGGLLGAAALMALGVAHENFGALARIWWFGDALGELIVTPLILLLSQPLVWPDTRLRRTDLLMGCYAAGIVALLGLAKGGVVHNVSVTPTLLLPAMLYLAVRLPPVWSAVGVGMVAIAVAVLITRGRQPFGALPGSQEVMWGQEFILIMGVLGFGFAALMQQVRDGRRELEARVARRTEQLLQVNLELARQVRTDSLTNLLNRRAFYEDAARECERCVRYGRPLAVLMFDLDFFKSINDQYGHLVGDDALIHFAGVLANTARASDTVARYGGEEFVLLAPETDPKAAMVLAERIRVALASSHVESHGHRIIMTTSIGIAALSETECLEQVLDRADMALYEAKSGGRDRLCVAG